MQEEGGSRALHTVVLKELPLVSIIIVTYNAGKYLRDCLSSVFNQSFKNIEILIIDGYSTDNTLQILKEYDQFITYWLSEPDSGVYDAMNKGVKKAVGDWLIFLGADDRLLDGFSLLAQELKDSKTIYYGYCLINNKQSNKNLSEYWVAKRNVCHQAVFYPKKVFTKYSYNLYFEIYADHALNIQCWGDATFKKKYYSYPVANYSLLGLSNQTVDLVFLKEQLHWIKKYSSRWVYFRFLLREWKKKIKGK